MTFNIRFTPGAKRDLLQLPEKVAWAIINFCEGSLSDSPTHVGKPLQRELTGLYSARRGSYRVIYRVISREVIVLVVRIRHRSDVYHGDV